MMGLQGMKTRRVTKVEKPRPLKLSSLGDQSMEGILNEMDSVAQQLNSGTWDRTLNASVAALCENLKMFGPQLENVYKDQLDKCYISLRNGCRDDRLPLACRYRLLEVIELRAMHWQPNENLIGYYKQKLLQIEAEETSFEEHTEFAGYMTPGGLASPATTIPSSIYPGGQYAYYPSQPFIYTAPTPQITPTPVTVSHQQNILCPGEVIKSSGKFSITSRVSGKNYCKDEVVIRNADSGKVAPGARERLVQITGPTEENINHARQLIEETIRRNASPVRNEERSIYNSLGGSSSSISSHTSDETLQGPKRSGLSHVQTLEEPVSEYRYTVTHCNSAIRITGNNLQLVRTAKLVLDEFFNGEKNFNNIAPLIGSDTSSTYSCDMKSNSSTKTSPSISPVSTPTHDVENNGIPKNGQVTVVRQPLLPSSKDLLENVESDSGTISESARSRRSLFAKTNEEKTQNWEDAPPFIPASQCSLDVPLTGSTVSRVYSREFLVKCADSSFSHLTPQQWDQVIKNVPAVVKKNLQYLSAIVATLNELGKSGVNGVPTYLPPSDLIDTKTLLNSNLLGNLVRTISVTEDEDNGNN